MAERPASVNFDRIAESYDVSRGGDGRGVAVATALEPQLPPDVPLIEVGIGTGVVAAAMATRGRQVVGIDLSSAMLARARSRLGPVVARADAQRLPFADGTLPAVFSVWVLHLVADVAAVLAEVRRVLAPGAPYGVVCSGGPSLEESDADVLISGLHVALDAPQGRVDSPERIAALAAGAGLVVTSTGWVQSDPYESSPNLVADELASRSWSSLWDLDEASWAEHVVPVIEALRALPDPDRPRVHSVRHPLVLLRRPN